MTNYRKRTALVLVLSMLMLALGGCVVEQEPPQKEPIPELETQGEVDYPDISLMLKTNDYVMESWPVMEALFKMSRCDVVIKTVRPYDYANKVARVLASGEPKDLVQVDAAHGLASRALFTNVAPIIAEQAPNYYAWSRQYPKEWNALSTNTGEIFVFPMREDTQRITSMAFIKSDEETPQSLDMEGLYAALEGKMLAVNGDSTKLCEVMAPFFGTSVGSIMVGDQAIFGPTHESFKTMLKELNRLYKGNKIEKDIAYSTRDMYTQAVERGDVAIAICPETDYEWISKLGYKPVMLNLGDGAYLPSNPVTPTSYGAIAQDSGKVEDVIRFLETCFTPEGRQLLNSGIHGTHSMRFEDGRLEMLDTFAHAGTFQWHEQGLTPEGVPGIYYNAWSRFDTTLYDRVLPMKAYEDAAKLVPEIPNHGEVAKQALLAKGKLINVYHKWWTAFIKGEKSVYWDWNSYIGELRQAGLQDWIKANYGDGITIG